MPNTNDWYLIDKASCRCHAGIYSTIVSIVRHVQYFTDGCSLVNDTNTCYTVYSMHKRPRNRSNVWCFDRSIDQIYWTKAGQAFSRNVFDGLAGTRTKLGRCFFVLACPYNCRACGGISYIYRTQ